MLWSDSLGTIICSGWHWCWCCALLLCHFLCHQVPVEMCQWSGDMVWNDGGRGLCYESRKSFSPYLLCAAGQARLDGAFCDYSEEDKMAFLKRIHDRGVRNIEMESLCFAAYCHRLGLKSKGVGIFFALCLHLKVNKWCILKICDLTSQNEAVVPFALLRYSR